MNATTKTTISKKDMNYVRNGLVRAGVPMHIIEQLPASEIQVIARHRFHGKVLVGHYYTEITTTGIRNVYGQIEKWGELINDPFIDQYMNI